jgi:hypothetical protein
MSLNRASVTAVQDGPVAGVRLLRRLERSNGIEHFQNNLYVCVWVARAVQIIRASAKVRAQFPAATHA